MFELFDWAFDGNVCDNSALCSVAIPHLYVLRIITLGRILATIAGILVTWKWKWMCIIHSSKIFWFASLSLMFSLSWDWLLILIQECGWKEWDIDIVFLVEINNYLKKQKKSFTNIVAGAAKISKGLEKVVVCDWYYVYFQRYLLLGSQIALHQSSLFVLV